MIDTTYLNLLIADNSQRGLNICFDQWRSHDFQSRGQTFVGGKLTETQLK